MKINMTLILFLFGLNLMAQNKIVEDCYNIENFKDLKISSHQISTIEATKGLLVLSHLDSESLENSTINFHVFSEKIIAKNENGFINNTVESVYYTSGQVGYESTRKIYVGECDAGNVEIVYDKLGTMTVNPTHLSGAVQVNTECSNGVLIFDKILNLKKLPREQCSSEINSLPKLKESEIF